jgi:hypothetical protein
MGAVLVVLSDSDPRRSGTNNVPSASEVGRLDSGKRKCQEVDVPAGADDVAVAGVSDSGTVPTLALTLSGMSTTASGETRDTAPDGRPLASLHPVPPAGAARLCVRNVSRDGVVLLGISDTFGVDYYEGHETWWQVAPAVARRFAFGKAGFVGAWTFWLALALVAGAMIAGWRALAESGARA